jgi:hypothetical protein
MLTLWRFLDGRLFNMELSQPIPSCPRPWAGSAVAAELPSQWELERFLLFREPQPTLCYVENDGAVPFKGDFARKV